MDVTVKVPLGVLLAVFSNSHISENSSTEGSSAGVGRTEARIFCHHSSHWAIWRLPPPPRSSPWAKDFLEKEAEPEKVTSLLVLTYFPRLQQETTDWVIHKAMNLPQRRRPERPRAQSLRGPQRSVAGGWQEGESACARQNAHLRNPPGVRSHHCTGTFSLNGDPWPPQVPLLGTVTIKLNSY